MAAEDHPVQVAVRVLGMSESGFYAWRNRGPSARSIRHVLLTDTIRQIHAASNGVYGVRWVHVEHGSLLRFGSVLLASNLVEGVVGDDQPGEDEQRRTGMAVAVGVGVGQADTCEQPAPQDARAQLGDRLDTARLKARLSKSQLAARAALSRTTVTAALNNTGAVPSKETVTALARALGLDNGPLLALRESAAGAKPVSGRRAGQGPAPSPSVVHTVQGDVSGTVIMAGGEITLTSHPRPERTIIADQAVGVEHLSPAQLQVHAAVLPAPDPGGYPFLTPYLPRPHDVRLCKSLEPALDGETSVLVMLTGGSSTGKTRALYEALHTLAPHRPLLRPATANDLLRLLADAQVDDQVVLWLNEAQRFFYGTSAAEAAAALHHLLHQRTGIVAVGTLWTSPYWEELTRFGTPTDPHAQVRELLTDPATAHIPVPDDLSTHEQDQWKTLATTRGDRRMRDALQAGAADRGRVVQHLSGGPALVAAYDQGPGHTFTAVEHALLTAAIDARRLGHRAPLPAALLAQAADADLDPRERPTDPDWAQAAITALCTGRRSDGARTDIRHTLTALHPHVPRAGAEAVYEPADYLDQHLRYRHADRFASPALWQALLDHTHDPDTLHSLAEAAERRGLFRHAARLWLRASSAHSGTFNQDLVPLLTRDVYPHRYSAYWMSTDFSDPEAVAHVLQLLDGAGQEQAVTALLEHVRTAHVDLTNPEGVARLLKALHEMGQEQAVAALLERDPANHADLTKLEGVALLLWQLRALEQEQAVAALLERDPVTHADLTDPSIIGFSLRLLRKAGLKKTVAQLVTHIAGRVDLSDARYALLVLSHLPEKPPSRWGSALGALATHTVAHTDLTDPTRVASLLNALHEEGQEQTVAALLERDLANHIDITNPAGVNYLLRTLHRQRQELTLAALATRSAARIDLTDPEGVAGLLRVLHDTGQEQAMAALLERDPATHADLTDPEGVAYLMKTLREMRYELALAVLATRAVAHTEITDPEGIAHLLGVLHGTGQEQAIATLLERHPATHADPSSEPEPTRLWKELCCAGEKEAATVWEHRLLNAGQLHTLPSSLLPYGRELDGSPAQPWSWDDVDL